MKRVVNATIFLLLALIFTSIGWWLGIKKSTGTNFLPSVKKEAERTLDVYTIENLSKENIKAGKFNIVEKLVENDDYTSHVFSFEFRPSPNKNEAKKTTGQINIPSNADNAPIILMLRGYVDQELYDTGDGTRNAAGFFAKRGFITVAPDFLGYAGSDKEADNIFEARFQTYVTAISLLNSLDQLKDYTNRWDDVGIWGHSNGGQIALTVLEITGKDYPTTLWAPVSQAFPYSILYYTDGSEDRGKLIRGELSKFEGLYNPDLYSLDLFLDRIDAPIQLHQGTADDAVPKNWSDGLYNDLKEEGVEVEYYLYPGADHNLQPDWDAAVQNDLEFFEKYLK